jgi:hypothetical protein
MQPGDGDALLKVNLADSAGTNYDLIIKGGDKNILETPEGTQPVQPGGARKYGDFDPHFGNIEVTTWERGWGGEDLSEDEGRFKWAVNMWTATKGKAIPAPYTAYHWGQKKYTYGNLWPRISSRLSSPLKITGRDDGYYSQAFSVDAAMSLKYAYAWIKYEGTVGDNVQLQAYIYSDSGGSPSTAVGTATLVTLTDERDFKPWVMVKFTFSTPVSISASTTYHLVIYVDTNQGAGKGMNDFYIAINPNNSGNPGKKSTDGTSWGLADGSLQIFIRPALNYVKYVKFVELQRTVFKLIQFKDGTNELWMMGEHGKATSATSTTIVDTNKGVRTSWTTNQWANYPIVIVAGTGVGQENVIASNTTGGSITVSNTWDITPDSTSEYAIICPLDWYEIPSATHALSKSKSVISVNNILYFSMGYGVNMRRMNFNGSAVQFAADGTNDADILFSDGVKIWKMTDDDGVISYASKVGWGTNLTFTAITNKTDPSYNFTGAGLHGGNLYFFKENSIYIMSANDTVLYPFPTNMAYFVGHNNGRYVVTNDEYLVFSWGSALERLNGLNVEHVDPNRDGGMDGNYTGIVGGIAPHPAGTFFAVSSESNGKFSTVNIYDGVAFHNAFTPLIDGVPIKDLLWVTGETFSPMLLFAFGEHVGVQYYPFNTTNPVKDGVLTVTQGELYTAVIDMGNKSIPKFFNNLVLFLENIIWIPPTYYGEAHVYYKIDSGNWTYLTTTYNIARGKSELTFTDPDLATINALSNVNELEIKIVLIDDMYSGDQATLYAMTLKGFARTPIKSTYSFPIDVSAVTERLGSGNPDTMMTQFWNWAMSAEALLMTSQHPRLHNKTVIIVPRSIRTNYIDRSNETFAADFYLEVREV